LSTKSGRAVSPKNSRFASVGRNNERLNVVRRPTLDLLPARDILSKCVCLVAVPILERSASLHEASRTAGRLFASRRARIT
jgi:hypothetical protein